MSRSCHRPNRLIQSPRRAFGCFSLLILNDRAAPSYQLLDLSLAVLPLDRPFLVADLLSFEVGVLAPSFLDNCLPLINRPDSTCCGRDASYLAPPAQIRTCSFPAYGSYLGCETAK